MAKTRCGKCRSRLLGKEKRKLLLLWRYLSEVIVCLSCCLFWIVTSWMLNLQQDALDAADFKKYSPRTRESLSCWNPDSIGFNLIEHVLCHICQRERPGAILVFMTGWDDINALKDQLEAHPLLGDPSRVLLLACHGSMASAEQVVFHFIFSHFKAPFSLYLPLRWLG